MWAAGVSNAGYTGDVCQNFARSLRERAPPQGGVRPHQGVSLPAPWSGGALTNTRDTMNGDGIPNRQRLCHRRQLAASHIIDETADLYILWDER